MFKGKAATAVHKLCSRKGTPHKVPCIKVLQAKYVGEKTMTPWKITMNIKTLKRSKKSKIQLLRISHLEPFLSLIPNIPK